MKVGSLIDKQSKKYVSDYLEGMSIPTGYEIVQSWPQDGLFEPTYDDATKTWKHGLTQAEIDAIKNAPQPKTEIEKLKDENEQMNLQIIDLFEQLIVKGVL